MPCACFSVSLNALFFLSLVSSLRFLRVASSIISPPSSLSLSPFVLISHPLSPFLFLSSLPLLHLFPTSPISSLSLSISPSLLHPFSLNTRCTRAGGRGVGGGGRGGGSEPKHRRPSTLGVAMLRMSAGLWVMRLSMLSAFFVLFLLSRYRGVLGLILIFLCISYPFSFYAFIFFAFSFFFVILSIFMLQQACKTRV